MFRSTVTEPAPVEVEPADLIPLSHFALDHPQPSEGWGNFLAGGASRFGRTILAATVSAAATLKSFSMSSAQVSGGRRTQLGLIGAIGFHLALWLFGWGVTIYALIMFPALILLLRAERRAAVSTVSATAVAPRTAAAVEVASRNAE